MISRRRPIISIRTFATFQRGGNFAVYPPNHYYYDTLNYFSKGPNPAPPSRENWLGTDDRGRDVFARLLYGFRVSVIFGLVLTAIGTVLGMLAGAVQGYFGGRTDLTGQRLIEIWSAMPELYLLIIFASIFEPSLLLLWCCYRCSAGSACPITYAPNSCAIARRTTCARRGQWGLSNCANHLAAYPAQQPDARDHVPAVSHERRDSRAHQPGLSRPWRAFAHASLGELLAQGKANLDAWWISLSTFGVLVATLLLLTFMGDALRNALDTRISDAIKAGGGK